MAGARTWSTYLQIGDASAEHELWVVLHVTAMQLGRSVGTVGEPIGPAARDCHNSDCARSPAHDSARIPAPAHVRSCVTLTTRSERHEFVSSESTK